MPDAMPCPHCVKEGAEKPRPIKVRGMCQAHYTRKRRSGELPRVYAPRGEGGTCGWSHCEDPVTAKGLCKKHYYLKNGRGLVDDGTPTPVPARRLYGPTCRFDGCGGAVHGDGYCGAHYWQSRNKDQLTPIRERSTPGGQCQATECDKTAVHLGLCYSHYDRKRVGDPDWDRPVKDKAPDGAGHLASDGYRMVRDPASGRVRGEHCVIMERVLGRPLFKHENVHHLNGQRADNTVNGPLRVVGHELRSGNLALWSKCQPPGQRVPDKMDFAAELFRTYGGLSGYADVLRGLLALHGSEEEKVQYRGFLAYTNSELNLDDPA